MQVTTLERQGTETAQCHKHQGEYFSRTVYDRSNNWNRPWGASERYPQEVFDLATNRTVRLYINGDDGRIVGEWSNCPKCEARRERIRAGLAL